MYRSLAAAAFLGLVVPTLAQAEEAMIVTPTWLVSYTPQNPVIDFRPTINATGEWIVFERTLFNPGKQGFTEGPNLYIASATSTINPPQRLVPENNAFGITGSARADWCWAAGAASGSRPIAFSVGNGVEINKGNGVYTINSDGSGLSFVPGSVAAIYPTWYPSAGATCTAMAVDAFAAQPYQYTANGQTMVTRGPQVQRINPTNGAQLKALSGTAQWGAFADVNPARPTLVVFAGQQFVSSGYNQDMNYVYVADTSASPPLVKPLDQRAPTNMYDPHYQGRAPQWSPDGKWVAFESNRTCGKKDPSNPNYALYLQDSKGQNPAVRVTACAYNGQHVKWYPAPVNGRTLVYAALVRFPGSKSGPVKVMTGVASLDVTDVIASLSSRVAAK